MKPFQNALKKYIHIMQSGHFTESDIRGFRRVINNSCRRFSADEVKFFVDAFYHFMPKRGYTLEKRQCDKGISWLKDKAFRRDGSPRRTQFYPFPPFPLSVLKSYKTFFFVGFEDLGQDGWNYFVPVYRCVGKGSFDYTAAPMRPLDISDFGNYVFPKKRGETK